MSHTVVTTLVYGIQVSRADFFLEISKEGICPKQHKRTDASHRRCPSCGMKYKITRVEQPLPGFAAAAARLARDPFDLHDDLQNPTQERPWALSLVPTTMQPPAFDVGQIALHDISARQPVWGKLPDQALGFCLTSIAEFGVRDPKSTVNPEELKSDVLWAAVGELGLSVTTDPVLFHCLYAWG